MEHIEPTGKTVVEEFTEQFVVKKNNVPSIMSTPNYLTYKLVLDAVEMNLIK